MPTISFSVERKGYAEQFVQKLQTTMPQALDELLVGIKDDIAANAPHKSGGLASSFYTIPAEKMGESSWEGYIASSKADQARAHEYGSGLHGPARSTYPIVPKNARFLVFKKEGKTLRLPMVMHPGVYALHYIDRVIRTWTPAIVRRFGDAIQLAAVHHWGTY